MGSWAWAPVDKRIKKDTKTAGNDRIINMISHPRGELEISDDFKAVKIKVS
jgi:hypothetical protein